MLRHQPKVLLQGALVLAISLVILAGTQGRASADEPLEEQIEQAVESVEQEAQDALAELGELDTPEKTEAVGQIIQRMESARRELKAKLHSRAADRFEELNDLAIARARQHSQEQLEELGDPVTEQQRERAAQIRARLTEQQARLEANVAKFRSRVQEHRSHQPLPRTDRPMPPDHAPAYGRRAQEMSDLPVDQAVAELRQRAEEALNNLGELDTPGKVQRAKNLRTALERRIAQLRDSAREQVDQTPEDLFQQQADELRRKAQAALAELGELDTPEKQEKARQLQARLEAALSQLRQRLGDQADPEFQERFDAEASALREQAREALRELGTLDSRDKVQLARQIQSRLDRAMNQVRHRLQKEDYRLLQHRPDLPALAMDRDGAAATGLVPPAVDRARDAVNEQVRSAVESHRPVVVDRIKENIVRNAPDQVRDQRRDAAGRSAGD